MVLDSVEKPKQKPKLKSNFDISNFLKGPQENINLDKYKIDESNDFP